MLLFIFAFGRLAQRESTAFTRRGSLVRTQYRPPDVMTRQRTYPLAFLLFQRTLRLIPQINRTQLPTSTLRVLATNVPQTCDLATPFRNSKARRVVQRQTKPDFILTLSSHRPSDSRARKMCRPSTCLDTRQARQTIKRPRLVLELDNGHSEHADSAPCISQYRT